MWKSFLLILCLSFSTSLYAQIKVLAFAGSSRTDSVNKKLALEAAKIARELGAEAQFIDLKDYPLPLYDADLEKKGMPENAKSIRQLLINSQVILIASPEYNASISALLKNTIDWASRSEKGGPSREAFKDKKFILMSAYPGSKESTRGLPHLRTIIEDIGGIVIAQQFVVPNAYQAFDEEGHLKDPRMQAELKKLILETIKPGILN